MSVRETADGFAAHMAGLRAQVSALASEQANILAALHLMLDTLDSQNRLLQELAGLAKDEPDSSPLLRSLEGMRRAIRALDSSLQGVADRLETLPQEIGAELARQGASDGTGASSQDAAAGEDTCGP